MTTTTISSLMEFLLALLGDDQLEAEFREDPEGVLQEYGLDNMCGTDIEDVAPMLADHVGVETTGIPRFGSDDDTGTAITTITKHYVINQPPDITVYNYYYVDDSDIIITVDDRDTVNIHAEGDLTITDSFNEDNDITVIDESYNQDNDGVDNKGGSIDDSVVTGDDMSDSLNTDDDTAVSQSHNTTDTETNTDLSSDTTVDASYNDNTIDNDGIDIDAGDIEVDSAPTAVHETDSLWPTEDADAADVAEVLPE